MSDTAREIVLDPVFLGATRPPLHAGQSDRAGALLWQAIGGTTGSCCAFPIAEPGKVHRAERTPLTRFSRFGVVPGWV